MTKWTRRVTIGALSGALALPAILRPITSQAQVASPPGVPRQAAGYYRTRVGDLIVTTLFDGELRRPVDKGYVRNASIDEVREAMRRARMPADHFFNPYVFTAIGSEDGTDDGVVLIDTGTGDLFDPSIDEGDRSMEAAGIAPEAVSLVILTHFHPDHIGGLTRPDGTPAFPNAQVLFPEPEHAFLLDDAAHDRLPPPIRPFVAQALAKLAPYAGRTNFYRGGDTLAPGLAAIATPGHTPGHMAVRLASGRDSLIVVGDAITYAPIFAARPGWHVMFDADGPMAEASRRALLEESAADGTRLIGTHFPFPGIGGVVRDSEGYHYMPEWWAGTVR